MSERSLISAVSYRLSGKQCSSLVVLRVIIMPHARSAAQEKRRDARRMTKASHSWQIELEALKGAVLTNERRDGVGAPWVTQWDHVSFAEGKLAGSVEYCGNTARDCPRLYEGA